MQAFSNLSAAPKPVGPYSQAVKVGELIFCAGQIALDPASTKMVEGGVEAQTRQVMENLQAVLKGLNSSWGKVAMTTIFLADIADGPLVNKVYAEYVNAESAPARQTVAVKALPLGALVEISVIAAA